MPKNVYIVPYPIVNEKEKKSLQLLTDRYSKLVEPNILVKAGNKIGEMIPESVKELGNTAKQTISEAELFAQCMKVVTEGFNVLEKQAAKMSISEAAIIKQINKNMDDNEITVLEEICLARGYDIAKAVTAYKRQDLLLAVTEGGATGYFGFAGLPFNLVLSTFLYYRAVQSIAMYYGYDVKNDPSELVIASEVFVRAMSPGSAGTDEMGSIIGKIMLMTEFTAIKQTVRKSWADVAARGGMGLLLAQMRALANSSAKKALEKAGQKGLEKSIFKEVFEQIGKKLSLKMIGKAIPVAGAAIGALFDTAQMNKVLEFADVFYNKRYIMEKDVRINILLGREEIIIDSEEFNDSKYVVNETDFSETDRYVDNSFTEGTSNNSKEMDNSKDAQNKNITVAEIAEEIKKAKELLDMGVISEVDFEGIKQKLIAKL